MVAKIQFQLDLEPSLTQQFRTFKQVLAAAVYGSRGGLSAVAAHCDLSPSQLTRMLCEDGSDPRHLPADLVPLIVDTTCDLRPVHWLIAKFIPDEATRQRAAVSQLESLIPQVTQVLATLQKGRK